MFGEFRFAARALARWRGGAVAAIVTLAMGIGTTTGLYALAQVLLADLPGVPELHRLARLYAASPTLGVERSPVAFNELDALSRATSFASIGGYADEDATLGTGTDARAVIAGYASPGFFGAMAVPPAAGRVFTASDLESSQPVVILSHALWRRQFPDGRISNATIAVDGVARTVIGVMPPEFRYGFVGISADLWIPLVRAGRNMPAIVNVYARLREDVAWPAAAAELAALASRAPSKADTWTWRAIPIDEDVRHRALAAYAGTLGPALLVLLIACVNVACMLMARGIERDKELSVRRALGATRLRIVRLLLAENFLLALTGGAIGGALAVAILRVLGAAFAAIQPSLAARLAVDIRLLPVAVVASALACVIFGTAPALRLSKRDVAASLNGEPPASRVPIAAYGARDVIVFAELASAVGLVVWTAMLFTLFAQIRAIAFTFPADHIVAMRVPARGAQDAAARVAAVPGVARAAISSGMLGGGSRVRVEIDGGSSSVMSRVPVGDGFFETLGVPLIRGRSFDASELHGRSGVAILSETAARHLMPAGDPMGMRIAVAGRRGLIVIGICRDAIEYGALSRVASLAPPEIYVPYEPPARDAVVLARVFTDAHAVLRAIGAAAQIPEGMPPARPIVLSDDVRERSADGGMIVVRILAAFATLTLLLAATGVFAVISQSVAQRTREFGIRMAIGATPRRVLRMVLARETKLIGLAVIVGVVFTMALTRALFVELTRLSAVVPSIWIGALALAGAATATAVAFATWRIVRLEPSAVLRRL
jgi:putative ABC transport system permease protein